MFSYALKRVTRSAWLFAALLLGVVLASTFFAGINVSADTTAKAALDQQLNQVFVDITVSEGYRVPLSSANWTNASESSFVSVVMWLAMWRRNLYEWCWRLKVSREAC